MTSQSYASYVAEAYPRLGRVAYLLTANQADADDLLHDTLIAVNRRWDSLEPAGREAYLLRSLVNNRRRRFRRQRESPASSIGAERAAVPSALVEDRCELAEVLATLPSRQRTAVVLRYCLDLSEQEVARLMGCSVGTVKSQAARGLTKLRNHPHFLRKPMEGAES